MLIGLFAEYKGYVGSIEYDMVDGIHYGSLQNTKDLINYHAKSVKELLQQYHEAVDDYIEFKKQIARGDFNREKI